MTQSVTPADDGWIPWEGGECAPADWDRGAVRLRDGCIFSYEEHLPFLEWGRPYGEAGGDIVGYHREQQS